MAKFPTDVDESVTIAAPCERVYAYLWDGAAQSNDVLFEAHSRAPVPDEDGETPRRQRRCPG